MVAQFTAKVTNSEKVIYCLPPMSCSINKVPNVLCFQILRGKKVLLNEMVVVVVGGGGGGWLGVVPAPFLYGPVK